jgi:hypothetical protein
MKTSAKRLIFKSKIKVEDKLNEFIEVFHSKD